MIFILNNLFRAKFILLIKQKINKQKIINDPIYGFVSIPNPLLFDIIEHPFFQRLRRINQMGMSNLVYPGANHTRFHHAIGCMHLMQKAVQVLRSKQIEITTDEENALYIAILLHDIGHGAFSHALEHSIVSGISHESISLLFMKKLNEIFNGQLSMAIRIFEGKYPKKYLTQLVSSQLDIDRLDYLKRDSFYTGVAEGNISSERLITMMNVSNDELVIDQKGIYSVEKFLVARRLMYWQVYLHKTCLVAERMLVHVLQRAKFLVKNGVNLYASSSLHYFLKNKISKNNFSEETLLLFSKLDDYDIISALKEWVHSEDIILSTLSNMLINRKLLKIEISNTPFNLETYRSRYKDFAKEINISQEDLNYFIFSEKVVNQAYQVKKPIKIITKEGELIDIAKASDQLNLQALATPVEKYFCCYPKKFIR